MLPPVLEIYVVWHPGDSAGAQVAQPLIDHFHGGVFTGLIAGAVEVYVRTQGWASPADAPRPIPLPVGDEGSLARAALTVVVPVVGLHMARAVESGGPWAAYVKTFADARAAAPRRSDDRPIAIFQVARSAAGWEALRPAADRRPRPGTPARRRMRPAPATFPRPWPSSPVPRRDGSRSSSATHAARRPGKPGSSTSSRQCAR